MPHGFDPDSRSAPDSALSTPAGAADGADEESDLGPANGNRSELQQAAAAREIDCSTLYRWFVGLNSDEEVWDATTFTKNRDRLLEADVAKESLAQVLAQALANHGSQLNRPMQHV